MSDFILHATEKHSRVKIFGCLSYLADEDGNDTLKYSIYNIAMNHFVDTLELIVTGLNEISFVLKF